MSEFAFSGVGMNPHYGTPGNPADRTRVPGGSSSGAAVTAADRMCGDRDLQPDLGVGIGGTQDVQRRPRPQREVGGEQRQRDDQLRH